jgi:hypothetical protein
MAENRCDELFGKNGELIEYRKKQVLEGAFGIIQRHYEDKQNKMAAVAALFGKKLGEEFKMQMGDAVFIAKITEHGLVVNDCLYHHWAPMLTDLLMGEAVIIDGGDY